MKARAITTAEQAQKAEKVLSMLLHKIKKGIATEEEVARYETGTEMVLVYDWGTESYQNHVPDMIAAAEERKRLRREAKAGSGLIARQSVPDKDSAVVPDPARPLSRRAGRFAV